MDKRHDAAVMVQYPVRDAARCQILLASGDHAGLWVFGDSPRLHLLRFGALCDQNGTITFNQKAGPRYLSEKWRTILVPRSFEIFSVYIQV